MLKDEIRKKKVQRKKNKNERKKKATSCEVGKLKPKLFFSIYYTISWVKSKEIKLKNCLGNI